MQENTATPSEKDPYLWKIAKKRTSFRYQLGSYFVINSFFWILWYFTDGYHAHNGFPWPVWPMFGWGIGLAFQYMDAYVYTQGNSVEKEYDKLKQQQRQ